MHQTKDFGIIHVFQLFAYLLPFISLDNQEFTVVHEAPLYDLKVGVCVESVQGK
jgi:hypothetical protein